MDYLPGGTLAEMLRVRKAGLAEQSARDYFRQLVSAIHYCHEV